MADSFFVSANKRPAPDNYLREISNSYDNGYDSGLGSKPPSKLQSASVRKVVTDQPPCKKLYLYPLKAGWTKEALCSQFSHFGKVTEVYIDEKTQRWAFISMDTKEEAERALRGLTGTPEFSGDVQIRYAKDKSAESASAASIKAGPNINGSYQKPILTNGSQYQTLPNCLYCKHQTVESCLKCHQSFCSLNCMIRGYDGHTDQCIMTAQHSSQLKNQPRMPVINGQPFNNVFPINGQPDVYPTISQEFEKTSRYYLDHSKQSTFSAENSLKTLNINSLSAKNEANDFEDLPDKSVPQISYSKKFESRKPAGSESSKKTDGIQTNGLHRMKDNRSSRHPSTTNTATEDEDAGSDFNTSVSGKRGFNEKREREGKFNRWSKENVSSDDPSPVSENRSNKENERSLVKRSSASENRLRKLNDSSRDYPSPMLVLTNSNDLCCIQPAVSRQRPKIENEASWDNQSADFRSRSKNENELSWDNQPAGSRSRSKNENESCWDNQSQESKYRSKEENSSSKNTRSSPTESRPKKENAASRIRSSAKDRTSSRENRSPASGHSGYRSSNEKMSDDAMGSKRRIDSQLVVAPRKPVNEKDDVDSPFSSPKSKFNNAQTKNPEFSPPDRPNFTKNARFEARLADVEQPTITLVQETDALNYMMDTLQKFNFEPMVKFDLHAKCVCKKIRDGKWHRCIVVELNPLRVKFVDSSHVPTSVKNDDLRKLPVEFNVVPPFCYRVHFLNAENYELEELKEWGTSFEVEYVSMKEHREWNVNLIKKSFDEELIDVRRNRDGGKPQDYSYWKIILKENTPIKVGVLYKEPKTKKIFVTDVDKSTKLMNLIKKKNPDSLSELKEIRLNTMCLAFFEECWNRARITSVDPLEVYFIDFGNTEWAKKSDLKMIPDDIVGIEPLVVAVKFRSESNSSVNENDTVDIVPIKQVVQENVWIVRLASESEALERPSSAPELTNRHAPRVEINGIMNVQVLYAVSTTEYYVGPPDTSNRLEKMNIPDPEILKMKPLRTTSVGTFCLFKFDGIWSRAKIVKSEPLTILFIDFGNEEEVELEQLYPMPEKFQAIPPLCFKIHLQEPRELPEYVPLKIKKVSEDSWSVEPVEAPQINSNMEILILAADRDPLCDIMTYGVIPVELNDTFTAVQISLLKMKSELPAVKEPKIDLICAEWTNVLARVKIMETNPLTLCYLDFGYEEEKDTYCNLREIPNSLAQIDPLAFRIEILNRDLELREGQTVKIKIIHNLISEVRYIAEVISDSDSLSDSRTEYDSASEANTTFLSEASTSFYETMNGHSTSATSPQMEGTNRVVLPTLVERTIDEHGSEIGSVTTTVLGEDFKTRYPNMSKKYFIDEISINSSLSLSFVNKLTDSRYTGVLLSKESPQQSLLKRYLQKDVSADPNYKPKVGDTIAALLPDSDIWGRAVVLFEPSNVNAKYRVAMLDMGCACDVEEIARLHKIFHNLSSLSFSCEIQQFPTKRKPLKVWQIHKCEINERLGDGTVIVHVWNPAKPHQRYQVSLRPWIPSVDELGISKMEVQSHNEVRITSYTHMSSNTCYISLFDDESFRVEMMFMEDVADFCLEAEPMTAEPFISEIVGVEYEGSFWRGQVREKIENTYSILLLDRGIVCTSDLSHMRSLDEHLKISFSLAVPVTLKHVPITETTPKALDYMKNLIVKNKKFDVIIDEKTGEVELKSDDGPTVNESLVRLLTPAWMKEFKKSKNLSSIPRNRTSYARYYVDDLQYDELVVGSKVNLFVAEASNADFCVVNKNGKNYKHLVNVNLYGRLAEYANTVDSPYVPISRELCIAKHEDAWYRAVCLISQPNTKIQLLLIDDGRYVFVWHTHIRIMIEEFSHYVATALICTPKDEKQFDMQKAKKLVDQEIRVKILEKKEPVEYIIDCCKIFSEV